MTTLRSSFAKTARNTAAATYLLAALAISGTTQSAIFEDIPLMRDHFFGNTHSPNIDWRGTPFSSARSQLPYSRKSTQSASATAYGHLPLSFEPNIGQVNLRAQFLCRGLGYSLFLTPTGAVMAMQRPMASPRLTKHKGHCLPRQQVTEPVSAQGIALYMTLLGANPLAKGMGESKQSGVVSYFPGKNRSQWHSGIVTFGQVRYRDVYPGVDLLYYGNNHQLEYDLIVKPGADYHQAKLRFSGAQSVALDKTGNLQLKLAGGETVWKRPVAYQMDGEGKKQWVASRYVLNNKSMTVRFVVGRYDHSKTLVLDPGLVYSTYLGGSGFYIPSGHGITTYGGDSGNGIAVDSAGNAYVVGQTSSTDFPTTPGAFQTTSQGIFITKMSPVGTQLVYSTYLGGGNGNSSSIANDSGSSIAIDADGNAYVTGRTFSSNFPTTPGAFQPTGEVFVTKLNATGTALVYSTCLGGSGVDICNGIAVDNNGNACVVGETNSIDFPTTTGAFQTNNKGAANNTYNAFVTKLNAAGTALLYSTYLGGSSNANRGDSGNGIAVDSVGNAYVVGTNSSTDFPTTPGAFQTTYKGTSHQTSNAFVTKLNAAGTALLYSTYLGGSGNANRGDSGNGIAVDSNGSTYVVGTTSSADFPTTPGAFQTKLKGSNGSAYVTKLSADGKSLVYSTYLGGNSNANRGDSGNGIAVDTNGSTYVVGTTYTTDFPTTSGAFQTTYKGAFKQTSNAFVVKLNAAGTALLYSTYLGGSGNTFTDPSQPFIVNGGGDSGNGIAMDNTGGVYVIGTTYSTDFPTTSGAFQTTNHAAGSLFGHPTLNNAFVTKLTLAQSRFDVNGDGHLDLLWYSQTTGDLTAWLQNGIKTTAPASLASHVDLNWKVTGVADLNGDGSADLLWRQQKTGDLVVWYMQGSTYVGNATIAHSLPLAWQIVSSADLNGDGNPDLLLRNTQTGDVAVWYMQGATVTGYAYLAKAVPLAWQLAGSADFANDGHTDLLWRNTQNGDLAAWHMSNIKQISYYYVAQSVPLEWQIGAVGDLDGNGVPDILWRNTRTGDVAAWLFSDPTHYTGASIASAVPLNWQLVGPR